MKRLFVIGLLFLMLSDFHANAETISGVSRDGNAWTYEGDLVNGKFHGYGTKTYESGLKYIGEWKEGEPYGRGIWTSPDGFTWDGVRDERGLQGHGTITSPRSTYVGGFLDGNRSGEGTWTITWTDGEMKYIGQFKKDRMHGYGTQTDTDGSVYVGEWKRGSRHGQGNQLYKNGARYIGQWEDATWHGTGIYIDSDGNRYIGEFKEGSMHGYGVETNRKGSYVGETIGEFVANTIKDVIRYDLSGNIVGTTSSNLKLCAGCEPTQRQLALVGQIVSDPLFVELAAIHPIGWSVFSRPSPNNSGTGVKKEDASAVVKKGNVITPEPISPNSKISVSREAKDIYLDTVRNILVQTRYCYEYVYYEGAVLRSMGTGGTLIFPDSGSSCDVSGVYEKTQLDKAINSVRVSGEGEWYIDEIKDLIFESSLCLELELMDDAVYRSSGYGSGTLIFSDGDSCNVEGVYSRINNL